MPTAFLVDLDGTIIDSRKPFIAAYNMALDKNGLPRLPPDDLEAMNILRRPVEEIFPKLLGIRRSSNGSFVESFVTDLKEAYAGVYLEYTVLCPSAKDTIEYLRRKGRVIGIVTSRVSFADYVLPVLDRLGVGSLIDVVVTSKDVTLTKPYPEPFLLGAKKLGKAVGECVAVGDSPEDIIAGKAAGMMTVAYSRGFYSHEELSMHNADLLIDDLNELMELAD